LSGEIYWDEVFTIDLRVIMEEHTKFNDFPNIHIEVWESGVGPSGDFFLGCCDISPNIYLIRSESSPLLVPFKGTSTTPNPNPNTSRNPNQNPNRNPSHNPSRNPDNDTNNDNNNDDDRVQGVITLHYNIVESPLASLIAGKGQKQFHFSEIPLQSRSGLGLGLKPGLGPGLGPGSEFGSELGLGLESCNTSKQTLQPTCLVEVSILKLTKNEMNNNLDDLRLFSIIENHGEKERDEGNRDNGEGDREGDFYGDKEGSVLGSVMGSVPGSVLGSVLGTVLGSKRDRKGDRGGEIGTKRLGLGLRLELGLGTKRLRTVFIVAALLLLVSLLFW
jgi:hypothetical protein